MIMVMWGGLTGDLWSWSRRERGGDAKKLMSWRFAEDLAGIKGKAKKRSATFGKARAPPQSS